jgi:hypothetical protein
MNNINQSMNLKKLAHRFACILIPAAISSTVILPVHANTPKTRLSDTVLFSMSDVICKKHVSIKPKNQDCTMLTVLGLLTLNKSKLDPIGLDIRNPSQRQAYLKNVADVLQKDEAFVDLLNSNTRNLTQDETVDILKNIANAYWVIRNRRS